MDNDPKSYRVPILHLKDVLAGMDEPAEETGVPATDTPSPQKTNPADPQVAPAKNPSVSEEDIRSAIITPKGQQPIVLDSVEKIEKTLTSNQKKDEGGTQIIQALTQETPLKTNVVIPETLAAPAQQLSEELPALITNIPLETKEDYPAVSVEIKKHKEEKTEKTTIKHQIPIEASPQIKEQTINPVETVVSTPDLNVVAKQPDLATAVSTSEHTEQTNLQKNSLEDEGEDLASLYS